MKSWFFSEQPYHPAWAKLPRTTKIDIPSSVIDPDEAATLLNRYMDEYCMADELGLDIMINEHHATTTCMAVSAMLCLSALARETKKARLLSLGIPALNRMDPFRIAEEIAYVDVLSRGRLEFGLIKGSEWELIISNSSPARINDRYWECHDVVVKALTTTDGPFSWEGEYFQYRYVNVIPRCFQQPRPPMWLPTYTQSTAREIARRDYTIATFINGRAGKLMFDAYKDEYRKHHKREPGMEKFAYVGLVAVGDTEAIGMARGAKVAAQTIHTDRVAQHLRNPPGFRPASDNARALKNGVAATVVKHFLPDGSPMSSPPTAEEMVKASMLFAGNPDQVFKQITDFWRYVGGFGNLIVQMGGTMEADENSDSLRLYATEVHPRLVEWQKAELQAAA